MPTLAAPGYPSSADETNRDMATAETLEGLITAPKRRVLAPPFTAEQWRRATEWPVTLCAVVFLVAYSWSVIGDLQGKAWDTAEWVMWSVWVVFLIDYAMGFLTAERRTHWFVHHIPQFLVVALPILRPLRLLRLLSLWNVLQRAAGQFLRGRVTVYVVGSAVMLVYIAALAELEAERGHPGAEITTFGQALWWAFETITTVGYGDRTPVTVEGQFIAVGLMIAGIGVLGIVTATLASWLVERVTTEDKKADAVTAAHVDALHRQVTLLTQQIQALTELEMTKTGSQGEPERSAR